MTHTENDPQKHKQEESKVAEKETPKTDQAESEQTASSSQAAASEQTASSDQTAQSSSQTGARERAEIGDAVRDEALSAAGYLCASARRSSTTRSSARRNATICLPATSRTARKSAGLSSGFVSARNSTAKFPASTTIEFLPV